MSCGAGESLLNALLTLIDPGDRVLLTDPTYSGMAQRVRLAGGAQVFTPLVAQRRPPVEPRPRPPARARRGAAASCSTPRRACPSGTVFDARETDAIVAGGDRQRRLDRLQRPRRQGRLRRARRDQSGDARAARPDDRRRLHVEELPDAGLADRLGRGATRRHGRDGGRAHLQRCHAERLLPGGRGRGARRARRSGRRRPSRPTRAGQRALLDALAATDKLAAIPAEGGYYCLLDTHAHRDATRSEFAERAAGRGAGRGDADAGLGQRRLRRPSSSG